MADRRPFTTRLAKRIPLSTWPARARPILDAAGVRATVCSQSALHAGAWLPYTHRGDHRLDVLASTAPKPSPADGSCSRRSLSQVERLCERGRTCRGLSGGQPVVDCEA